MSRILPSILLAVSMPGLQAQPPVNQQVLQAELAFAHQAEAQGIRVAFLAWLTPEARVFVPRMTTAETHYGAKPGDAGYLAWYPECLGVAASGDLAWSFGPWTYSPRKGAPALVHGHFLSLWRRQTGGRWRVEADIGVPHPAPAAPPEPYAPWDPPSATARTGVDRALIRAELQHQEAALAEAWRRHGGLAVVPWLDKEGWVLRPGQAPLKSGAALQSALTRNPPASWEPGEWHLSERADLAWTCGELHEAAGGSSASYLRVWRAGSQGWKVLFDVMLPHPPKPTTGP